MITTDIINKSKRIIIFDGIAGSGKTSQVVSALQSSGVDYIHTTSTNALKRSISRRFKHPAGTIAGTLFHTEGGVFYSSEKDVRPDAVIIIDEILQSSPEVFDWVRHHKNKTIICTDSHQMLSPGAAGRECYNRLVRLEESQDVTTIRLTETLRPVNDETRREYNRLFVSDSDTETTLPGWIPRIDWRDLEYSNNSYYMTHTNAYEKMMYDRYSLYTDYTDVIPKGMSPEIVDTRIPILPQVSAADSKKYYQQGNVGSVYRFQGREVLPGHPVYFLLSDTDKTGVREVYTLITRLKDVRDLMIVRMPDTQKKTIVDFCGLPLITPRPLFLSADVSDPEKVLSEANAHSDGSVYNKVIVNGKEVRPPRISGMTCHGLLKREPQLAVSDIDTFYQKCAEAGFPDFQTPQNMDHEDGRRDSYKYGLDLYAAYPHCWKLGAVPDGTTFRGDDSGEVRVYMTTSDRYGKAGTLITSDYYNYMVAHGADLPAVLVGSYNILRTDRIGGYLCEMSYKSAEAKARLKNIHYGYMQKKYYEPVFRDREIVGYTRNDSARYELLMTAIQSELCFVMARLRTYFWVDVSRGRTCVDCLYFDTDRTDFDTMGEEIKDIIPGYDFRIFRNTGTGKTSEKPVLYKSYPDLLTNAQIHAQRERLRRKKIPDAS